MKVIAAAFACCLLAAPVNAADPVPYEINAIVSLTGAGAFLGADEADGLRMVESAVNRAHGIDGRPIKFIIQDDQSSPQVAVQILGELAPKKVPVILGSSLVAACNAMAPLMQSQTLYCLSGSYAPPKTGNVFTYGIPVPNIMRVHLGLFRARGARKIAAIVTTDATGQDGERAIHEAMALPENASLQLVDVEHFAPADVSVAAQMARIKAAAPDLIIAYVAGTPLGTILQARSQIGLDVPISTSAANFSVKQMAPLASLMPAGGLYIAVVPGLVPAAVSKGPLLDAVSRYVNERNQPGTHSGSQSIIGWDSGTIVVTALRAVGLSASGDQVGAYIRGLHDYYGAAGEYDFRTNSNGLNGNSAVMVRYDAGKQDFVPVKR